MPGGKLRRKPSKRSRAETLPDRMLEHVAVGLSCGVTPYECCKRGEPCPPLSYEFTVPPPEAAHELLLEARQIVRAHPRVNRDGPINFGFRQRFAFEIPPDIR